MQTIWSGDTCISGEELEARVARAATGYKLLGVRAGDTIAMLLRNDLAFFEVGRAAGRCGAQPVAINWHSSPVEAAYILEDCGAKLLVGHADLLADLYDSIPAGVTVIAVPTSDEIRGAYSIDLADALLPANVPLWPEWRDSHEALADAPVPVPAVIIYTSGTTGKPKGVRRKPPTELQARALLSASRKIFGYDVDDETKRVAGVVGPIYHAAPNGHANFSYAVGADVVIFPKFDPELLLQEIERRRITHLSMVPIMFSRLLKLSPETRSRYDLTSLRFVVHAAAPCPPALKRAMIDWWGPIIHEFYGSTETGSITMCDSEEWLSHPGTVGRPLEGVDVRIIGSDGADAATGEAGEIICKARGLTDFTYHGADEKRREIDRLGLIASGDIGYFDADGYLFLVDRAKDLIISGGVNIYPAEIEAELHLIPEVGDCAVFGIPDEEFGESVCAVIERQLGTAVDDAAIRASLQGRIAGYKIPRTIVFADKLPREDSGKIFKRKLREPFWVAHARQI